MTKEKNVQPIRSKEAIEKMKDTLIRHCSYRDYFLFVLGINVGFRITDLISLKVKDVKYTDYIHLREKKTGKYKKVYINANLKSEIEKYTSTLNSEDFLFTSRKGNKPITITQVYRTLQKAAIICGITNVGSRTLRKTFGYHHYKTNNNIHALQEFYNHSHPKITKQYIGLEKS